VCGFCSIPTALAEARAALGVCPQGNTLFQDLTVEEHLRFFAALRRHASHRGPVLSPVPLSDLLKVCACWQ
jgi:ABC-type multidrug transport system ATPase subunit